MIMKRKMLATTMMVSLFAVPVMVPAPSSTAQAQLLGVCPSPIMPPPCIIFDYKKLAQMAQEQAQVIQKIQQAKAQIEETKNGALTIGQDVLNLPHLGNTTVAQGNGESYSAISGKAFPQLATDFSASMYLDTATPTMAETDENNQKRQGELRMSSSDAYAMALTGAYLAEQSQKRLVCLGRASKKTTDARGDQLINVQINLEIVRQNAQKNVLLSSVLQNTAVATMANSTANQSSQVSYGSASPAPEVATRSPGWEMQDKLKELEGQIRNAILQQIISAGVNSIKEDLTGIESRYANSETERERQLAIFQAKANRWKPGSGNYIVATTLTQLAQVDAQMAALRAQPIANLSGAFQQRNINAQEMMANDVDPRQFIGTWADPMKYTVTDNMAKSLTKGALNKYLGGDENDEYRKIVFEYNDARLEEAWMREHAQEVPALRTDVDRILEEEKAKEGQPMDPASIKKRLNDYIAQANALAAQIQSTNDPVVIAQASNTIETIKKLMEAPPEDGSETVIP